MRDDIFGSFVPRFRKDLWVVFVWDGRCWLLMHIVCLLWGKPVLVLGKDDFGGFRMLLSMLLEVSLKYILIPGM